MLRHLHPSLYERRSVLWTWANKTKTFFIAVHHFRDKILDDRIDPLVEILKTFPLVAQPVKDAAFQAYRALGPSPDDGTPLGLAHDLQALGDEKNLNAYGKDVRAFLRISFGQVGGHDICKVLTKPPPKPIWIETNDRG